MSSEPTNTALFVAVALLVAQLESTENSNFLLTSIMFEDGSGNKFTGHMWHKKNRQKCGFFFRVTDTGIEDFNVWPVKPVVVPIPEEGI